jgi:hypothetical protein
MFCILDFSESDIEYESLEPPQSNILCENNSNVQPNIMKIKKQKKRNKKSKDLIPKCAEVEEVKKLLLEKIEEKDIEALNKFILLEETNSFVTKEYLEKSLNEAIDDKNNTVLHLTSINCLHGHI